MHRLTLVLALVALAAGTLSAEARARIRFGGFSKVAVPAKPSRGPASEPGVSSRPGFVVVPAAGAAAASTSSRPDIPTGSVAPAPEPAQSATGRAPDRPSVAPRDPCASNKLFGAGQGFCAVN